MTTVDIPELARVGSNVEACHLDFDKARRDYADRLHPRIAADWAAGGASANAVAVWQAFLSQLSEQVRDLGQSLTTSAHEFQAADDNAANRFHTAGAGIPTDHPAQPRAHGHVR